MMRAALALWAARSAPRMTKELRPLAAMAMALPLARIARSTTLPLTISALEFGNRALMLGGRPTWSAFSKSSAYAMEGLLQGVVDAPTGILPNPLPEVSTGPAVGLLVRDRVRCTHERERDSGLSGGHLRRARHCAAGGGRPQVLTDPLLRLRVGVLLRHSPVPPAHTYRDLDAVVISHAHIDHLDVPSLRLLDKTTPVLAPQATEKLLRRIGFADVTEMEAGQSRDIGGVTITATPAMHGATRHPLAEEGNALGYVVRGSLSAYFAGDTGLFDGMAGLADHLDVALLPVGGWGPRLPDDHLNPLTAAKALALLRPRVAVPIHWGTLFPPWLPPTFNAKFGMWPHAFTRYAAHLAPGVDVRVLEPGETTRVEVTESART